MDNGVNRYVHNGVPEYLSKLASEVGRQLNLDSASSLQATMNLRFKHASRRLDVPTIYPGYVSDE